MSPKSSLWKSGASAFRQLRPKCSRCTTFTQGSVRRQLQEKPFFSSIPPPAPSVSAGESETRTAAAATCGGRRQARAAGPASRLEQPCLSEQGSRAWPPSLSHPTARSPGVPVGQPRGTAPHVLTTSRQTGTGVVTPSTVWCPPYLPSSDVFSCLTSSADHGHNNRRHWARKVEDLALLQRPQKTSRFQPHVRTEASASWHVQRWLCPYGSAGDCVWLLCFLPFIQIWLRHQPILIFKKKNNKKAVIPDKWKMFSETIDVKVGQLPLGGIK